MRPQFTIVTVCFNSEATIATTIESVLAQEYSSYEYIIVDGASSDSTLDIIKSYEGRFDGRMKWISERDRGIYEAINKGVALANGVYISILNSDDWYVPDTLLNVAAGMELLPDVIYGDLEVYDRERPIRRYCNYPQYLHVESIAHPATFVRSSAYSKYGCYSLVYKSASDYEFFLRLYKSGATFQYVGSKLACFRIGGMSSSHLGYYETLKIKKDYGFISLSQYLRKLYSRRFKVTIMMCLSMMLRDR